MLEVDIRDGGIKGRDELGEKGRSKLKLLLKVGLIYGLLLNIGVS